MKRFSTTLVLLVFASACSADYSIDWHTIDGGGGSSSGGGYVISGSISQPDAGWMSSCEYYQSGGFWNGPGDMVDMDDLFNFVSEWLESDPGLPANLDGNNGVDLVDYSIFASYWLCYCPDGWEL